MFLPDYSYRSQIIASGLVKNVKKLKHDMYIASFSNDEKALEILNYEKLFLELQDPDAFIEAQKIACADFARNTRLKKRIASILDAGEAVFCTLTFTNDVLENTNEKTRRLYVTQYLKAQSSNYVANIDYGAINRREHYHAVLSGRVNPLEWRYGALNCRQISVSSDPLRIAKYINKLVNHAIKETASRGHIIYSRSDSYKERDKVLNSWLVDNVYNS